MVVDINPPELSAALFVSAGSATSPVGSGGGKGIRGGKHLYAQFNMFEPVQRFDLSGALQLSTGLTLINAECFEGADTAAIKLSTFSAKMVATAGVPIKSFSSSAIQQSTVESGSTSAKQSYIRSCLAVLYGQEGSTPVITLPEGAVMDVTGNPSTL